MLHLANALLLASLAAGGTGHDRLVVVERENEGYAVLENGAVAASVDGLGNTNHAIVKFNGDSAYVIGRDGYVSRTSVADRKILKRAKVGNSGIGFEFVGGRIAIANYDPRNLVITDLELNVLKTIETGSRNVGIKAAGDHLVFSLMDKDEIWVLDARKDFEVVRKFTQVGKMPFDALLSEKTYVVGFFAEPGLGVLDLDKLEYRRVVPRTGGKEVVLKVPHFGTWGVAGGKAYVPAVGARALRVLDLSTFELSADIPLSGLPVFAVMSPDRSAVAVNFSGDSEDLIEVVDVSSGRSVRRIPAGKRVMHLRFSPEGERLYVSSYFESLVKVFGTREWKEAARIAVRFPSGIFIAPGAREAR